MAAGILKEFLVSIGFEVNEQQYKKFEDFMGKAAEGLRNLAIEGAAAVGVLARAVDEVTQKMDALYFTSQRTGASAQNLTAFGQAASQIGISAEHATGLLETMASVIRTQPGIAAAFGIKPGSDPTQTVFKLLDKFKELKDKGLYFQASRYASLLGIDERSLFMATTNLDKFKAEYARAQKEMKDSHADLNKDAVKGNELASKQRDIMFQLSNVKLRAWEDALPTANKILNITEKIFGWWDRLDAKTQKWAAGIAAVVLALGTVATALAVISLPLSLLGGAGAATGVAGAVGAGVSAIATVVAAVIGAGVVIAAIAGVYELWKHRDAVTSFGAGMVKGLPSFLHDDNKVFDGSLSDVLKHFEGAVKGTYADIGGKITSGIGHLVRPGEKAPTTDAEVNAQFQRDSASVIAEVKRVVKVHLTSGQEKALDDFVFNLGNKPFEQSIAPLVNSGNMAAVAQKLMEFDKYHNKQGQLVENDVLHRRRSAEASQFSPSLTQHTEINVNGASDPHTTAQVVLKEQRATNASIVRNMGGVVR